MRTRPNKTYTATVDTNCGHVRDRAGREAARPKTSASFVALARDGFYDGLGFHRIAPGFVIQGGDPNGDGTGGPGYKTRERAARRRRLHRGRRRDGQGRHRAGRHGRAASSSSSPAPDADLPADYAVLGKVVRGMDVVKRIEAQAAPTRPSRAAHRRIRS